MKDLVRAKIIEAVPEIEMASCELCDTLWPMNMAGGKCDGYGCGALIRPSKNTRPIQLSDVLRAIEEYKNYGSELNMDSDGSMEYHAVQLLINDEPEIQIFHGKWDLTKPFDEQSPELFDFLYTLLT